MGEVAKMRPHETLTNANFNVPKNNFFTTSVYCQNQNIELIIVDNVSTDNSQNQCKEKFPQVTKLQFPENFLVGSNLTVADLTNASFFLNSLNSRRLEKLKKLSELSQRDSILSKINTQIVKELSLEPLKLIQQLEKMPKLDLVSLSKAS